MSFESLTGGARWPERSWSARAFLLVLVAGIAALCPDGAAAGVVTQPEHVSMPARGLNAAERRALTVTSISAVGDRSLGLFVTVAFRGNVERYLGQDRLANGMLGLVLVPAARRRASTGLVDVGGGYARVPIPILQRIRGRGGVKRGVTSVFTQERTLPMGAPRPVEAIRNGNRVIFYLPNVGPSSVREVKLKVFAAGPIRAGKRGGGIRALTASGWRAVLHRKPTGLATVTVDPSMLTGDQLQTVRTQLAGMLSRGLEPELRRVRRTRAELKADVRHYPTISLALDRSRRLPRASKSVLARDLRNVTSRIGRLRREITQLSNLVKKVTGLSQATRPAAVVEVVQTDPSLSQEMTSEPRLAISTIQPPGLPIIDVNEDVRYQQFSGVGAALTDSSAWLIGDELTPTGRAALLQALFGPPGLQNGLGVPAIHLNFLRVAIGASGAMTVGAPYSYDDMPSGESDPSLSNFSISHDLPYIIPTLKEALSVNPGMQILANPWSPPGWMKSNDSLDNPNGHGTLLSSDYRSLADYFVKFIRAYQANGVPIEAITPENEPSSGQVRTAYPGMTWPEAGEARFVAQDLKPALRAAGLGTKIFGSDESWDSSSYADDLATGSAAADLAGIAWHCYFGTPTAMSQLHEAAPGRDQIVDECSPEIRPFGTPEFLISSLRNWASLVSVWAVALDPNGGPIQPGNDCPGCTGPVAINEQTHGVTFRPEYYQLGQVSAFVQPGAWRIGSSSSVTYGVDGSDFETASSGLDDVAFLNPDGSKVLIAYNHSAAPISFAVDSGGSYFTYTLPAWAMTTFAWS